MVWAVSGTTLTNRSGSHPNGNVGLESHLAKIKEATWWQAGTRAAACYKLLLNTDVMWDWSHGVQNDILGAMKSTNQFAFVLLMLVVLNLPHGPEKDEALRFSQLTEMMQAVYQEQSATTCVLFQHHAPAMLEEMRSELQIPRDAVPEEVLWRTLATEAIYPKLGSKVRMCKFAGWVRAVRQLLPRWSKTLFHVEYLGLELDVFGGKTLQEKIKVSQRVAEEEPHTTSDSVTQVDAKLLRSTMQNGIAIACMTLQGDTHRRIASILVHGAGCASKWQAECVRETASVPTGEVWLQKQHSRGLLENCAETLAVLHDVAVLQDSGFLAEPLQDKDEEAGRQIVDDELASLLATYVLILTGNRLARVWYFLQCWPWKFVSILQGRVAAQNCISEFRRDVANYEHYCGQDGQSSELQDSTLVTVAQGVSELQAKSSGSKGHSEISRQRILITSRNIRILICPMLAPAPPPKNFDPFSVISVKKIL